MNFTRAWAKNITTTYLNFKMTMNFKKNLVLLQIVTKNTSTLDYSLPILWKTRKEYPEARIVVLFSAGNKKQLLRHSVFFTDFFVHHGIEVLDFSDFLKTKSGWFKKLWQKFTVSSPSDALSFFDKIKHALEKRLASQFVDLSQVLPGLNPDIILFDQKTFTEGFYGKNIFYDYLIWEKKPIVLMPHAPHFINPTDEYFSFYEKNPDITDLADFWKPFQFGKPEENLPTRASHFPFVGYPGLDAEWLEYLLKGKTARTETTLTCLLVIRKFLPKGFVRPENYDPFTLDYTDMKDFLTGVGQALKKNGVTVKLLVKPHPSNNFKMTVDLFKTLDLPPWEISFEPFYGVLPQVDFGIGLFSTANVIPMLGGIPMILVNTKLHQFVHQSWDVLADMYRGLDNLASNSNELDVSLKNIVDHLYKGRPGDIYRDGAYLRKFFPDGSLAKIMSRIKTLLGKEPREQKIAV